MVEPKSYEPAGSTATTWSVVPTVSELLNGAAPELPPVVLDDSETDGWFVPAGAEVPPLFLPAPQALSTTARTTAVPTSALLLMDFRTSVPFSAQWQIYERL